ncbi:MAG: hypothetical protein WAU45_11235 [Blastocatellia bacterium]
MSGKRSEAIKTLDQFKGLSGQNVPLISLARSYAALGDKEQALAWLENAYAEHRTGLLGIRAFPEFDHLHSHARFQDLLRRIGFPQ